MASQYRDNPNMNIHEFEDYTESSYVDDPPPSSRRSDSRGGGGNNSRGGNYNNNNNNSSSSRVHPIQNGATDAPRTNESQKITVDFDAFSSDAEKLSAILKCADIEQHKHTLSVDYFYFRKYFLIIPVVLMSLLIAIGGFVAASDIVSESMKVHDSTMQDFLTILVATFGFLVLLLTILGNGLDYNSKVKFHKAAAEDLNGLCDKVRLYRMERAMDENAKEEDDELKDLFHDGEYEDSTESEESSSDDDDEDEEQLSPEQALVPHNGNSNAQNKTAKRTMKQTKRNQKRQEKLTKKLVQQNVRRAREEQELSKDVITFYGYHTELHQISRGCRSDVPPPISKFFRIMENRVELMSLSRLGVEEESRMRKNQIVRLCAHEIYNEISNYWGWPLFTPSVDSTIEYSLKRVGQLLNMNYRAQRRCKLIPCCPVPLCCKKKTTNNVFAIINEGIDQRELDMMQAERTELVRMENDRRARRMAGPEEVLEMSDMKFSDTNRGGGSRKENGSGSGREPKGSRAANGAAAAAARGVQQKQHPEYYAPEEKSSRMSRDPDGGTYNEMATEASHSFRGSGNVGGYANHHYQQDGNGAGRGGAGGLYPQDRSVGGVSYLSDGDMMTAESGTYAGGGGDSYAQQTAQSYDEEMGTLMGESEEEGEEDAKPAEKKSKKKKKKKSKKKKKKKSKSKKKEEKEESFVEDDYSEYSEEEYSDGGFTNEDEYSEYSEEE